MLNVLVTANQGVIDRWLFPEEGAEHPNYAQAPPGTLMPGCKEFQGKEVVHLLMDCEYSELDSLLPPGADVKACQDYRLTYDYDEEGNVVGGPHGVHKPVPSLFRLFMEDKVELEEDGNETGRVPAKSGDPLHIYAGSDPWVWE